MPRQGVIISLLILLTGSCTPPEVKTINRFDTALYDTVVKQQLPTAHSLLADTTFMTHFTSQVLGLKSPDMLSLYYGNEPLRMLYTDCQKEFTDLSTEETLLNEGARRWTKEFSETPLPQFVACVSGWRQKVVLTQQWATISIDYYLGEEYPPYQQYFFDYDRVTMNRSYIVRDLFDALLTAQLQPYATQERTLLAQMIEEGRRLWLLQHLLPSLPKETIFGFTNKQLKWCSSHERKIWNTLISANVLYETDPSILRLYLTPGPSTSTLPEESPARAVCWMGYRIIDHYLRKTSGRDVELLFAALQAQEILRKSEY